MLNLLIPPLAVRMLFPIDTKRCGPCRQQLEDAIVLALVNEAAVVMEAGVAEKAEDVDAVCGSLTMPLCLVISSSL